MWNRIYLLFGLVNYEYSNRYFEMIMAMQKVMFSFWTLLLSFWKMLLFTHLLEDKNKSRLWRFPTATFSLCATVSIQTILLLRTGHSPLLKVYRSVPIYKMNKTFSQSVFTWFETIVPTHFCISEDVLPTSMT